MLTQQGSLRILPNVGGIASRDLIRLLEIVDLVARAVGTTGDAIAHIERLVVDNPRLGAATRRTLTPAEFARQARKVRLARNDRLGAPVCRDPAWDILLDLLASRDGDPVAVSSLCFDAGVPPTTALRHVQNLAQAGLIRRTADESDHRRVIVNLTDCGAERVTGVIRDMQKVVA